MNQQEAIQRWDTFLLKIRERANELLEPAREQALALFIESGHDAQPIGNALHAIRLQVLELGKKVTDMWAEKVGDLLHESGLCNEHLQQEKEKGTRLQFSLERDFALLDLDIRNQLAQQIAHLAKANETKASHCTQCLAPLPIALHTYTSAHITCAFCNTVNTYEPGTYKRMLKGYFYDMARWNAREETKIEMEMKYLREHAKAGTEQQAKENHQKAFEQLLDKYLAELKKLDPTTDMEKEKEFEMQRLE
jgi:hypothetical protein